MSCCSVHIVYHKPTLSEGLARAKILQSECKYPETNKQLLKRLHVLLRSTRGAISLRSPAISWRGLSCVMPDWIWDPPKCLTLRASGYLYNSSTGSHAWLRRFWIFEVRILGKICRKFQWQRRLLSKPEAYGSLKCLHRLMLETRIHQL